MAVPSYARTALRPSVVHLSVGQFHRAHQAVYFDDLARQGETGWGIVGVGLRRAGLREVLDAQDGLWTVASRGARGDEARIVGVMRRYLHAPDDRDAVVAVLADPRTRLVTLTVTADGYRGVQPGGAWWYLAAALDRRRRAGLAPFTVLSCDNLLDNGAQARTALVASAARRDRDLAAWIEERVAFPSSMVDRITPRSTAAERTWVAERFGVDDRWPVVTETFSQWVIEDAFAGERPPLEAAGAQVVADVRPFALAKTRLLNASHLALGLLGSLAGLTRLDEAMRDPVLSTYAAGLMDEVRPLLPALPGLDLDGYVASLLDRLANPSLPDELSRLRRGASGKVAGLLVPSIEEARAAGRPHCLLTAAVAAWLLVLRGTDERGRLLDQHDDRAAGLQALALVGGDDPRPLLTEGAVFGALGADPEFAAEVARVHVLLRARGIRAGLAELLDAELRQLA